MKIHYFLSTLLLSTTLASAAEKNKTEGMQPTQTSVPQTNTIKVNVRPEISGLWGMYIPENKRCVEYYNFKSKNQLVVKSGDEWSTGIYDYQPPQDPSVQLPALILQIKYDNNEVDCSGQQVDQTGEISQYYVQWKSPTVINFCTTDKAEECFATLYRVLP